MREMMSFCLLRKINSKRYLRQLEALVTICENSLTEYLMV